MKHTLGFSHAARWLVLLIAIGTPVLPGVTKEITVATTNWVDQWITNVIEVKAPANHFVNRYHTNWVDKYWTNVVSVYNTNRVTRFMTNHIAVDVFQTNLVAAYQTNFVAAYKTNFKTLHLTNWNTVLVLRTNWVNVPVTNVVELEMSAKRSDNNQAASEKVKGPELSAHTALASAGTVGGEPLAMTAHPVPKVLANHQIEVKLFVHWTNDTTAPVQVQQWRVEREDGTILCFGQDQEFKRALPAGKYKVRVKAQRETNGPLLAALGTLAVSPSEVILQQRAIKN
ncbi:MAG TPA: hypothetical protein VL361_20955 [Candidatus Limnocylindrales bacterium]|jgi:hypothetical protein|nr:hypothetical protein [Candidatus Limnocylindrales bacterium]